MTAPSLQPATLPFGTRVDGTAVSFGGADAPNLLIVGASGTGKTFLLERLSVEALRAQWDVCVVDIANGGRDFGFARPGERAATTMDQVLRMVREVREVVIERLWVSSEPLAVPILLIVDEAAALLTPVPGEPVAVTRPRAEIIALLSQIAREGRAAQVHVVLATAPIPVEVLGDFQQVLAANFSRISMGHVTLPEHLAARRKPGQPTPPSRGQGLFEPATGKHQVVKVTAAGLPAGADGIRAACPESRATGGPE